MRISAVLVNHNTSAFAELAIRSLFVQNPGVDATLTVYDNDSTDDRSGMLRAAERHNVAVYPSGFPTTTAGNSHGEVLSRFVLDSRNETADHLLFLDADICFTRAGSLGLLADALRDNAEVFGVGPRMSWDGRNPMPEQLAVNPSIYLNRLHPCCALVKNTATFRAVVEHVGLSSARLLWAEHEDYLDTFELMTRIMRTHGHRHMIVDNALILHAFAITYPDQSSALLTEKEARRDRWLTAMRAADQ